MRASVEDGLALYRENVLPQLREQPGYEGVYVFANAEGRGMVVSFWDSEEAASAGMTNGWYEQKVAEFVTMFRSPPGRERYEVLLAEAPAVTTG